MFGDSSQDVFSDGALLKAPVTTPFGKEKTEFAFVLGNAQVASMKVKTVTKLELQAPLNAGWLKREYNWEFNLTDNQVIKWTDCTTVLQWII